MRASHTKAAATTSQVNRGLYLTCMKKRITRVALTTAMPRATGVLRAPKSCSATQTVTRVSTSSAMKTSR